MITIQELLYQRGLKKGVKIKMLRHKDDRIDIANMYRNDYKTFIEYQASQSKPIFEDVDYLVSFIGEEGNRARFVGVYEVYGHIVRLDPLETKYYPNITNPILLTQYYYPNEEVEGFEDLKDKIIVEWKNPIAWHQWINNPMEVVEISRGLNHQPFTDYYSFIISFNELREIIINEYPDWKKMLSSLNAVYLITDTNSGKHYIGSTYGANGIWGRWRDYVRTNGHGNNKKLQSLIDTDPLYGVKHFRFTILHLLSKHVSQEEAVQKERLYKMKLSTISCGLNNN